mmetsp:Transcript_39078/g.94519  ORF Transcript_39078/g.94519 Transcript_39078/m.94519 type:complete len:417 (-) Transcript_39078:132-1382(-)
MSTSGGNWKDLLKASRVGDIPLIEYHLRNHVDPNYQHPEYFTSPVFECIRGGHVDALKVLIKKGGGSTTAPEDATDKTPLEVAMDGRQHDIVDLLLSETEHLDIQRDVRPYFREVVFVIVVTDKNGRAVDGCQRGSTTKDRPYLDDIGTTGSLSYSMVHDVARAILDSGHQITINVTIVDNPNQVASHADLQSVASPAPELMNVWTTMEHDLREKTGNKKIFVQINDGSSITGHSSSTFRLAVSEATVVLFDNPKLHGDGRFLFGIENDVKTGSNGRYIVVVDHHEEPSSSSSTRVSDLLHNKEWSALLLNDNSSLWRSPSTSSPHLWDRITSGGYYLVSTLFSLVTISLTWMMMLQAHQEEKRKKSWVKTVAWMVTADDDVYMNDIGGRIHKPDSAQMYLDRIKKSRRNDDIVLF